VFLHDETYRLLTRERMNRYLQEAAADRRILIAALPGRDSTGRSIGALARILRAVVRALAPSSRDKGAVCRETHGNAS
jgi:hypothetical protein